MYVGELVLSATRAVLDTALLVAAAALAVSCLLLACEGRRRRTPGGLVVALFSACSFVLTWFHTQGWAAGSPSGDTSVRPLHAAVLGGAAAFLVLRRMRRFYPSGVLLLAGTLLLVVSSLLWVTQFGLSATLSTPTRLLLLLPLPVAVALLLPTLVRMYENVEPLVKKDWQRPHAPRPLVGLAGAPRVSIHVPAHAEPPEVVIATLDSLARLHYENFEVLVIDNNTSDPALWHPVQEHCEQLGPRFRFMHVEGLAGAKAGALNLALDHSDPSAELIAVVDADYQVQPEFLAETVAFFDDPAMGFVQTPHAYRSADTTYLRMCDTEYATFFVTGMVSLNERNAGITVGTMCVLRRQALERAGRWATWCLTEDSELAVRLHAAGYDSVYLSKVYGRGLIPDTYAGYRKQRFRWSYGPVSEFFAHWRLHVPGPWHVPSSLTIAQRVHHATHGLYGIATAVTLLMLPYSLLVAASVLLFGDQVPVPFPLWAAATSMTLGGLALRWLTHRRLLGASFGEWLGAVLATASLAYVVGVANLTALLRRPVPWQRTSKFRTRGTGLGAFSAARSETALAALCLATAAVLVTRASADGLVVMVAVGFLLRGLQFAAAPLVALLAHRGLAQHIDTGTVRHERRPQPWSQAR
ncbi:MAG: glycosyltransferase [Actinomycetota bacterium]|nr:glycosyltransferase [Actinomycetota bacterium]